MSKTPNWTREKTTELIAYLRTRNPDAWGVKVFTLIEMVEGVDLLLNRIEEVEKKLAEANVALGQLDMLDCQYCHKWFPVNRMYSSDACTEEHQKLLG